MKAKTETSSHDSSGTAPGGQEKPRGYSKAVAAKKMNLARAATVFALGAAVTLVAGGRPGYRAPGISVDSGWRPE